MKHWLIIYDIRNPKRLSNIAKIMVNFAVRVQKSVFEMEAERKIIVLLRKQVHYILDPEDYVVYFEVCERDWQKRMKYGPSRFKEAEDKPYSIL